MPESIISRFITGTVSTGFGRLTTMVLSFLSIMITARWLTKEEFGTFMLLTLISNFVVGLSYLGLNIGVTKFLSSSEDASFKRKLINTALYFQIIMVYLAIALTWLSKGALFRLFGESLYLNIFMYVPALICLDGLAGIFLAILEGRFQFRYIGIANIVNSATSILLVIIFIVWLKLGLMGRIYARVLASLATLLFCYFASHVEHRLEFDIKLLKRLITFSFPLFGSYLMDYLYSRTDTFLIGALLGPVEIALYEIARKFPETLGTLYDAFRAVFFPIISKLFADRDFKGGSKVLNHSNRVTAFFGSLGALVAFTFGAQILTLMFSDKYLDSVPVFGLLMIGLTFTILDSNLGYSLVAVGDSDKPFIINIIHAALSLSGYLILIPKLGIIGAALASILGTALVNPLAVFFLRRRHVKAKFNNYLKPLLILCLCLAIYYLTNPLNLLVKLGVYVVFIAASFAISVITQRDLTSFIGEVKGLLAKLRTREAAAH